MTLEIIRELLFWTTIFHFALLLMWFGMFTLAHDFIYQLHSKWFKISKDCFDSIHYAGIAFYKILIFIFSLVPLIALQLI